MRRRLVLCLAAVAAAAALTALVTASSPGAVRAVESRGAQPCRDSAVVSLVSNLADALAGVRDAAEDALSEARRPTLSRPLFVGNSLVEGMLLNSDDGFDFRCEVGISLDELNRTLVLPDGFDCVVVEMGSNELGLWDEASFSSAYEELLSRFDVLRFCLSVPPVNESCSRYAPRVNNVNVAEVNGWIRALCERTGSTFVDCEPFFGGELRADWTGDGLHPRPEVYAAWYEWVLDEVGVARGADSDS